MSRPYKKRLDKEKQKARLGEVLVMNNGLKATIIKYNSSSDVDVRFENGEVVFKKEYRNFRNGRIYCPMIYNIIDDYVECINPNINVKFLIDLDDLDKIKGCYFCSNRQGYIYDKEKFLHKYLLNADTSVLVDHINGDVLDNRKSNLRICTQQQNCCNRKISKNNTSGYKGVRWNKGFKKFISEIYHNKNYFYLGFFDNAKDVAITYNEAAIKYHGEFARLNIIE